MLKPPEIQKTVKFIDLEQYGEIDRDLLPEVRSYEYFKDIHKIGE